jgi:hypothetical protein
VISEDNRGVLLSYAVDRKKKIKPRQILLSEVWENANQGHSEWNTNWGHVSEIASSSVTQKEIAKNIPIDIT